MARVNRAYAEIRSHGDLGSMARTGSRRSREQRGPGRGECAICGHAPATELPFEYQEGFLLSRRKFSLRSTLCRDCGLAVGRSHQDRTLLRGIWGPTLFVANVRVVCTNARMLRRANALAEPVRVPGVAATLDSPMPAGNPVALRVGFWVIPTLVALVALAALVVCIWAGVGVEDLPTSGSRSPVTSGACLVGRDTVTAMPCSESHAAELVAAADGPADCPAAAQTFLDDERWVPCVRSSRDLTIAREVRPNRTVDRVPEACDVVDVCT